MELVLPVAPDELEEPPVAPPVLVLPSVPELLEDPVGMPEELVEDPESDGVPEGAPLVELLVPVPVSVLVSVPVPEPFPSGTSAKQPWVRAMRITYRVFTGCLRQGLPS